MQICGGSSVEEIAARLGMDEYVTTGLMACSRPEGVTYNLVCDADIYGVKKPAEYLKMYLQKCPTVNHIVRKVKEIYENVKGGYACALECEGAVYIFRDPVGLKPLYYHKEAFASEKKGLCNPALLRPGELVKLPDSTLVCNRLKEVVTTDPEEVLDALTKSAHQCVENDAALLFSGGIDSSILAAVTDAPLVTCGLEDSQDILFSRKAARLLKKEYTEVIVSEKDIKKAVLQVLSTIEEKTLMNLEIGLLLFFVCKTSDRTLFISGQGADELFGGYYKYEKAFQVHKDCVKGLMRTDLDTIFLGLERDRQVAEQFHTTVRYPYLAVPVVERALGVPVHYHFIPERKAFLRKIANLLHLPDEIVSRPKKALQYGSGIHKIVKKMKLPL